MHARSVFKKLLGWKDVSVKAADIIEDGLVLDVRVASPLTLEPVHKVPDVSQMAEA